MGLSGYPLSSLLLQCLAAALEANVVESEEGHKDAILLLDEPGLHLHPTAQQELIAFFEKLAEKNQLIYTTHSPFLIDGEHLHRVRRRRSAIDSLRWADPEVRLDEGEVWCVLEEFTGPGPTDVRRVIAAVPLDGSAARERAAAALVSPIHTLLRIGSMALSTSTHLANVGPAWPNSVCWLNTLL